MECKVAIDIGGTFTDFIVIKDSQVSVIKVLTNPKNPSKVIEEVLSTLDCKVTEIIHATTL
ncbi:MAG: hydantoinase/oxoprolinase N-terminal domain-containing protein, partial [Saccharolobus sp.]